MDPTAPYGELVESLPPGVFLDPRTPDGRCKADTNLLLAESAVVDGRASLSVSAAIFDVGVDDYNCDRQQYGVNIGLDLDALAWRPENRTFRPFVRLALARYQPYSRAGLELSRVLVADLIQLQPNRTAQITYDPSRVDLIDVTVQEYGKGEWTMSRQNAAPDAPGYTVRIELLRRAEGNSRWVPVQGASQEARIDHVGDGFLARARFQVNSGGRASRYAIRLEETIERMHGVEAGQSSDSFEGTGTRSQPVLFMIQPVASDIGRESA
jgi:hypothetical protein